MKTFNTLKEAQDATSGQHVKIVCTCGTQLENCRCWSADKLTVEVTNGCETCKNKS